MLQRMPGHSGVNRILTRGEWVDLVAQFVTHR